MYFFFKLKISQVQPNEALRQNAYLLFYSKIFVEQKPESITTCLNVNFIFLYIFLFSMFFVLF